MRFGTSRRTALLLAAAVLTTVVGGPLGARADHGTDAVGWIEQAGDGSGNSSPVIPGFGLRTVLYSNTRFPLPNGAPRPSFLQYAAWGTIRTTMGPHTFLQLALSKSDDGVRWSTPTPATIRDSSGRDLPFLLGGGLADVVFVPTSDTPFQIYWRVGMTGEPEMAGATAPAPDPVPYDIEVIHRAVSADGVTFEAERPLEQRCDQPSSIGAGGPVYPLVPCVLAPASEPGGAVWKEFTYGPTDVHFLPTGSTAADCADTNVWNCRWVMVYDANNGAKHFVGVAGSPDGQVWTGRADPALCPGTHTPTVACGAGYVPTAWDGEAAAFAHVRRLSSTSYEMYYSGGPGPFDQCGEFGPCWSIGVATSTNGQQFVKVATNPATPRSLIEAFSPGDRATLFMPQVVDDGLLSGSRHAKIYFTRFSYNAPSPAPTLARDTYLAYTAPAPADPPSLRIAAPKGPFENLSGTILEAYAADSLGTNVGIDAAGTSVLVDGAPASFIIQDSLVTAMKVKGVKITGSLILPDGPHTAEFNVRDLDGNVTTKSVSFLVDTLPPVSKLTTPPASPAVRTPGGPIGIFGGESTDPGTGSGLQFLSAVVTNPLGMVRTYRIPDSHITKHTTRYWTWAWISPSPDPHFLLPGPYTISVVGTDFAANTERPAPDNTRTVIVI